MPPKKASGPEVHDQGVDGDGLPVRYVHTVASGGSERGHNAMFLVYGAGAPPSRMGNFREN